MSYTKGPWTIEKCPCSSEFCGYWGIRPAGQFYQGTGFQREDAQLVSAAPDLLEALRGIIEIGKRDMSNPKYDTYFQAAQEALTKATAK